MNERIRELAEQAGYKPLSPPTFADELNEIFMRKFAELIVRDCQDNLAWHGHDEAVSQLDWFKAHKLGIK
jgi:hypothetical protein